MPDDKEIPDLYSDYFEIAGGAYGTVLGFGKNIPERERVSREMVARIRTSWEHAKVITIILQRTVKKAESEMGVSSPVPEKVLEDLSISRDDWDSFWESSKK